MKRMSGAARRMVGASAVCLAQLVLGCASTAPGGSGHGDDEFVIDARVGGGDNDGGGGGADAGGGGADAGGGGVPDAAPGPPDAATGGAFEIANYEISDSASSGTPDTYVFDVVPGGPVHAELTGTGSGAWTLAMSNGTTIGIWCIDVPVCDFVMPAGQTQLVVTARTEDIGFYTLRLSIPVP